MSLKQRIDEDLKKAMKARDQTALSVTRLLKSAITNREIELGKPIDDAEVIKQVDKQLRQRKDAANQFRAGNRPELAAQEEAEAALLESYLPARLTGPELEKMVDEVISELGAKSVKDLGTVMKAALERAQGRTEGKALSEIVKKKLSSR